MDVTNQGIPEAERFWMKVERTDTCWLWRGGLVGGAYGAFKVGRPDDRRPVMAHRYAYEQLVGPIPEGLELDHLCRVRQCVNPAHLEPVTPKENTRRGDTIQRRNWLKTECIRGHPFDEANTRHYTTKKGNAARACRACEREKMQRLRSARAQSPRS